MQVGKEEVIISVVDDDDPKDFTKKLQLINTFNKVTRYKINIQKSVAFFYTNGKHTQRKNLKVSFTVASEVKYLAIDLTKK